MKNLIEKQDFLYILQKSLAVSATSTVEKGTFFSPSHKTCLILNHSADGWDDYLTSMQKALMPAGGSLKVKLRPDYLFIMDNFRGYCITKPGHRPAQKILDWWVKLGKDLGISESQLQAERVVRRKQLVASDEAGCGWYKCLGYDCAVEAEVLAECAGCGTVVYCGSACQTR